jgi:hypothetical protein
MREYVTRATRRRTVVTLVVAVFAVTMALTPMAASAMQTPGELQEHGWSCRPTPVGPPRTACANPGLGLPTPDTRPVFRVWVFDNVTGELVGRAHFVHRDLYAGQPCHGGDDYVLRPVGYYECFTVVD